MIPVCLIDLCLVPPYLYHGTEFSAWTATTVRRPTLSPPSLSKTSLHKSRSSLRSCSPIYTGLIREPGWGMPQSEGRGPCSWIGGAVAGAGDADFLGAATLGVRLDRASRIGSVEVAASARGGFEPEGDALTPINSASRMGTGFSTLHVQPALQPSNDSGENELLRLIGWGRGACLGAAVFLGCENPQSFPMARMGLSA